MADHFFDYGCIFTFYEALARAWWLEGLDIRSTLYEVLARALSGLLKGLVRPCPGIQSALHMALCESVQGHMGFRESKGFGEGIMSLSTAS